MNKTIVTVTLLVALGGCAKGGNTRPPREVGCAIARGVERAASAATALMCRGEVTVGAEAMLTDSEIEALLTSGGE